MCLNCKPQHVIPINPRQYEKDLRETHVYQTVPYRSLKTNYSLRIATQGLSSILINNLLILRALKIAKNAFLACFLTIFAQIGKYFKTD